MQEIVKKIQAMDKTSDEFFEIYKAVDDKYWAIDKDKMDDVLRSASLMRMMANKCDSMPDHCIATGIIMNEVFQMIEEKHPVRTGMFKFGDRDVYFRIADHPDSIDKMQRMLGNTVMVQAQKDDAAN